MRRPARTRQSSRGGFSMLEMLVALAVMAMAGGLAAQLLRPPSPRLRLDSSTRAICATLRAARSRAIAADAPALVRFDLAGKTYVSSVGGAILDRQPAFEIQPRRQAEKSVGRPGETIDATVLAAPIGVDRAFEGNIRRIVAGDQAARPLVDNLGGEHRQVLQRAPAVVEILAPFALEAPAGVDDRAATPPAVWRDHVYQRLFERSGRRCA